jgi:MFS family permease
VDGAGGFMKTEKIASTFRAFKYRNYRLFFYGQSISQIGTWMQRTGVIWVVYTMTHSPFMLGLTVFASQFPSFVFSLPGGVISDRYNRYKLLLGTQIASMIQAFLLFVITMSSGYSVWSILILSAVLGLINAFDVPARQPLIHELVTNKADLPNAMALNSSIVNLARLIGPALSGLVLVKLGASICFLLNALSFIAVIISLLMIKMKPYIEPPKKRDLRLELKEGFIYLRNTPSIAIALSMLGLTSLLVLPYGTVLPVFAKLVFKGDADTFGYINSFIGVGAVIGSIFLATRKPNADLKFLLFVSTVIFGISLILFSHTVNFPLAMVFATLTGFGMMNQTTICMTIVQVESEKEMRGRVMSYVAMAYFGMLPLGSLLVGYISQHAGAPNAILIQGITALIIAAVFSRFLRKKKLDNNDKILEEEAEALVMEKI